MSVVAMDKVSIIGRLKDEETIMVFLQNSGIMHLSRSPLGQTSLSNDLKAQSSKIKKLQKAQEALTHFKPRKKDVPPKESNKENIAQEVMKLTQKKDLLDEQVQELQKKIEFYENFGHFKQDVSVLKKLSITLKLAVIPKQKLQILQEKNIIHEIVQRQDDKFFVALLLKPNETVDFSLTDPPAKPLETFNQELDILKEKLQNCHDDFYKWSYKSLALDNFLVEEEVKLERLQEMQKSSHQGRLFGISGFIKKSQAEELVSELKKIGAFVKIETPSSHDDVPVLLKNAPAIKGFESILRLFNGVNYFERDKTFLVTFFFVLFGSLCLLDAGYGLLLLLLGYLLVLKEKIDFGQVFLITGFFSCVLGLLCGQVFGFVFNKDILLNIDPVLNLATDPLACFHFSLMVGVFSLFVCNIVVIWQNGFLNYALGNILLLTAGVFWGLNRFVFDFTFMDQQQKYILTILPTVLLTLGTVCWVLFPDDVFGKQKKMANVLWTLYSGPVGLVQDILSHMRLFGIALSGSILAMVINKISSLMPFVVGITFGFLAHICVFALALLSLYIHTNRLIFLEFGSKCMKGGNNYFRPFKRRQPL